MIQTNTGGMVARQTIVGKWWPEKQWMEKGDQKNIGGTPEKQWSEKSGQRLYSPIRLLAFVGSFRILNGHGLMYPLLFFTG